MVDVPPGWELVGYASQGKEVEFGAHMGKISRILSNGCAFVECAEVNEAYGQDAYIHSSVVQQCGLEAGDEIAFNVHVSSRGLPQVSAPVWKKGGHGGGGGGYRAAMAPGGKLGGKFGGKGKFGGSPGLAAFAALPGPSAFGKGKAAAPSAARDGAFAMTRHAPDGVLADYEQYLMGTVKITYQHKGFSMIESPDSGLEADVYVHHSVAAPQELIPGDPVAFKVHVNAKGQPQASAPFWKLVGHNGGDCPPLGDLVGHIHKELPNGSAFLDCPEIGRAHV